MTGEGANASHFVLQRWWNSLNSFGAKLECVRVGWSRGAASSQHFLPLVLPFGNFVVRRGTLLRAGSRGQTAADAGDIGRGRRDLFRRSRGRPRGSVAPRGRTARSSHRVPAGSRSAVVENLVQFRGIQVWDDLSAASRQVGGRPALFRIGRESLFARGSKDRAARFRGDAVLRRHGRRAGFATVWTARRGAQHGAGGGARARPSATRGGDERGTGGRGPWPRTLQLLHRYAVGRCARVAIFYGHSRRKQERGDPATATRD